ncbi:DUF6093 family protein [Streptomyces antimycoticus]|uniref:DUF6093 family protein n=1 Tax=Streptomyces antimycoticus TaxID=68175 RepID=UPI003809B2C4
MGFDLSGVRRVVEKMLGDELELWRDADGHVGDVLDEQTGELKPGGTLATPVWNGPGAVVKSGQLVASPPVDGTTAVLPATTGYQALLPLASPKAQLDDVLVVKASERDAQLPGRRFRVAETEVGTFAVVRVVRLEVLG